MDIEKPINKLYNKNGLMQKYGGDVWTTILTIFSFGIIFTYIYVLNHMHKIKKNWATERCNPFIIPIAGWINNTNKTNESDLEYTVKNFESCLGGGITDFFNYISESFKNVINGLEDLFKDFLKIIAGLINYFMSLILGILLLIEELWLYLLKGTVEGQKILLSVEDSVQKLIGTILVVLYTKIILFRLSMAWMITTPIFMIWTTVVSNLIKLLIFCVQHQAAVIFKWTTFAFCLTGMTTASLSAAGATFLSFLAGMLPSISLWFDFDAGAAMASAAAAAASILGIPAVPALVAGAVASFISSIGAIVSMVISGIAAMGLGVLALLGGGDVVASCLINVTQNIYGTVLLLYIVVSITSLVVMLFIIKLCFHLVKSVLGNMNIPGQGLPGLSY